MSEAKGRNPWLLRRRNRTEKYWVACFSSNMGTGYILRPRRVRVDNSWDSNGPIHGSTQVSLVFQDAMINMGDSELDDFLRRSKKELPDWTGVLSQWSGLSKCGSYEISGLTHHWMGMSARPEDISLHITYLRVDRKA